MGGEIVRFLTDPFPLTGFVSDLLTLCFRFGFSRPKQVKDVAHQEEVVRVLTNTLETANVIGQKLFVISRNPIFDFVHWVSGTSVKTLDVELGSQVWIFISLFFVCVCVCPCSARTCSFMDRQAPEKPLRHLPSRTSYLGTQSSHTS